MVAKWPLEVEIAMGAPVPISVSSGHFALRYEVPKFLARGGHLCMAVLTIAPHSKVDWCFTVDLSLNNGTLEYNSTQ